MARCRVCGKETKIRSSLCSPHNASVVALNRFNQKPLEEKVDIVDRLSFRLKMYKKNLEVPNLPYIDVVRVTHKSTRG